LRTHEKPSMLSDEYALLGRLFGMAERRLQEHGILMRSSPAVVEWLLTRTDWRASLNPLRTLDGYWHQQVGAVIEALLLEGRLRPGNALDIHLSETPAGSRIQFDIAEAA
jgi:hypothetical protein